MNRNNIYTVNPLYNGSTTQATGDDSVQSGGTTIIYQQGGGTGLTDAQKQKLDGIQEGAEVNQNAYSKVRLNGSDALIIEAKNKTDILNMSGVYPIAIAINGNGGLDFTVSSDQSNTNSVVTQSQLKAAIDQLEKDKYWKVDADGKLYTELDVYSHKEISAYGAGTGGGSTGGAGALYECADVLRDGDKVKGAEVGSVLSYNGTHWYAIPQSAIVPDLSGYATKSYVSQEINDLIGGAPGTLDTLKEIAEALGNDPNFATTITNMINNIGLRVDDIEARVVSLEDMFEWDKSASASDSSLWRIKAKRDLFGVGEISAYGYSAGTVPTGAQYLYELKDVQLTDLATGQLLQYNGSKWVNIDKNAVGLNETELGRYLTNNNYAKKSDITWANLLNKPTTWGWASITGKPTTLAGYGITDGVPNTRRVSAGSGLAGGGVLSSDVTISLGTIGTAGTYTKITTDMYGRVVSGTTLSESDIPTLQISKISGLQSALNSKLNISDFNTWFTINRDTSGNIVSIQANYNLFSVGEVSAYGLGGTQPSITTLAGLDDVNINNPQNKQALIYDSASGKWINGASVGGGNISLNGTVYKAVDGLITLPNLYEKVAGGTSSQFLKADGSVDENRYWEYSHVSVPKSIDFTYHDGKLRLIQNNSGTSVGPTQYWGGLSAISNYNGFQLVVYGGVSEAYYIRKTANNNTWSDWSQLITSRNYEGIVGNKFVLKAGDTMTGRLTAPFFRANNMISVGVPVEQLTSSRAELNIITLTNNPCDIWMGANNQRYWSITARDSTENYQLGIYNSKVSNWNALFRDNINDFYVKTEVRDTFLVLPTTGGDYNEGIRIGNASNGRSNIQFGSQNAWNGKVDGQWVIGRNPAKCFQICLAGTETANTSKPGKGISIDINGYLDTGYIRPNIATEYAGNYFYTSNDAFIRRTTWDFALNCLNQNQLTLDLSSLDSNKWYPCSLGAPAYGGTPLRITIFNGLRGNKPSWASHASGFSLLLDYYVTGSGCGTLSAVSKLDWYHGSYGGETAFGGRQQNTMGSHEIIYLRGGGVYYYRTTNHQVLTPHPNGYSWANGSYTYSAAVKTSQDNSPMEKTFDQVYWAPNNLRNTRTIWGQSFNGSQNVSGALSGATTITATGDITTSANIGGRSINAGADLTVAGYTYCNGRLYVDRGRFSTTAAPAISLAIGDTDTGFHWCSDGAVQIYSNSSAVGMWTGSEFRYGHGYFKQASGNDYHTLGIMVNGNGTANTIKPGIGFHQPGVYAGSIKLDAADSWMFCVQGGTVGGTVQAGSFQANGGWLYSKANGCEVRIGSQNTSYVHFTNNADRIYYFDNRIDIDGSVVPYNHNANLLGDPYRYWAGAYISRVYGQSDTAIHLITNCVGGQQSNPQTYFGQNIGVKVAMTGSVKYWNDTLWINGYSSSDVKDMCALHTVRDGTPQMYISTQKSDATSYGTMYLFYTSYNANKSDRPWICSTLNAYGRITTASDIYSQSWVRTVGTTGWYSESYGGGIHMTDSTWVRVYNDKQFYVGSTSPDAIHTAGGINASGRIYVGGHLSTNGGLAVSGIYGGSGASGFNVYAVFQGRSDHGGIEVRASDNTFGIGVHSNDHMYWWWGTSTSTNSSSGKSYIMDYGGGNWSFTGNIIASGEVTAYSDARLKSNIHTLDYRGRLIPRHYVKDGKQSIGFIAQEVQTLYPELVLGYDKSRPYLSLNYNGCTAVLSAQLNYVEDEVTLLKNKVRELEIKVSVLTEQLHSQAI